MHIMSFWHNFNLYSTPILLLWPGTLPRTSILLWLNELAFALDIVRKMVVKKPKSFAMDNYDIFVEYLTSNMAYDLIASVPNLFSGMDPYFTFLKIVRVYEVDQCHYTVESIMRSIRHKKSQSEKDDVTFAISVIAKIFILLHYLSCVWIYIGGPDFLDYEEGYLPWQYENSDFHGMTYYQLYVFSTYWVFTVITTVGYGDYSGGTTLEYQVTLFLQFFGLVVFTGLQMSVTRVVNSKYNFRHYIEEK